MTTNLLPAARATGLTKTYRAGDALVHALDHVDVEIAPGQLTAVMGPSGSGKSTLMHLLAGLETPTEGRVLLGEHELTRMGDTALTLLRRREIGFVFQAFNLVPTLTAEQNILLPLRLARTAPDTAWFASVVDRLGLRDRLRHLPAELSGGQQQRVAIARALVTRPRVLFADEPTGALDTTASHDLMALLRRSVDEDGLTVVMVTHDPDSAAWADRVLVLRDGRIEDDLLAPGRDGVIEALRLAGAPAGAPC